ncbi:MAG: hypothetical protein R3C56_40430 [Pirellulaceae bacterium]
MRMRVIADRYRGYPLPDDFRVEGSRLHDDPEIKRRSAAAVDAIFCGRYCCD